MWRSVALLLVSCSHALIAGQIYGTVRDAAGKAVAGANIKIVSPLKTPYHGKTGADGSYQIFVKEAGRCEFQIDYGAKAPANANIFSYADPAKYEFVLDRASGALKAK